MEERREGGWKGRRKGRRKVGRKEREKGEKKRKGEADRVEMTQKSQNYIPPFLPVSFVGHQVSKGTVTLCHFLVCS